MRYPNNSQIEKILDAVSDEDFVDILSEDASSVDKVYPILRKKKLLKLNYPEGLM